MFKIGNVKNLIGQRFGKLVVKARHPENTKQKRAIWICICDCGNEKLVPTNNLKDGCTQSCGCLHAPKVIEIGKKFGMLTVTEDAGINKDNRKVYKCLCECGNEIIVTPHDLIRGHYKACGCRRYKGGYKHGLGHTRINASYNAMRYRCYNPKADCYHNYGGRGIKICDEWLGEEGNLNFYNWAINNGYEDYLTIDRIDNDGNYEPSNCRWADMEQQARNTRLNKKVNYQGKEWLLIELLEYLHISEKYDIIRDRIFKSNWDVEKALFTPSRSVHINSNPKYHNKANINTLKENMKNG